MTQPPTLDYQTPPSKDERPWRLAAIVYGVICGMAISFLVLFFTGVFLAIVSVPTVANAAISFGGAIWILYRVGRDVENAADDRGFLLGTLFGLPALVLSCFGAVGTIH